MPRAFVFDAYGTLFDVHAAIGRHRAAAGPDADRFSEIWRTKQLEYTWTHDARRPLRRFLDAHPARARLQLRARLPSVDRALRPALLDAYMTLDAFADARTVLQALKHGGHITAILSNGSPPMLDAAVDAARSAAISMPCCRSTPSASTSRGPRSTRWSPSAFSFRRATSSSCRRTAGTWPARRLRLPHRMGQPRRHAGRIPRLFAGHDGARPHGPHWAFRGRLNQLIGRAKNR